VTLLYLLDTNIISDIVRNPQGVVAKHIAGIDSETVATSVIVSSELKYGAQRRGAVRLFEQLHVILARMTLLPYESPADDHYAKLRTELEQHGTLVGNNDMLIAAQALAHDLILVTDTVREFSCIDGLKIENWLR
jgi:tRNA(fMet)-specific endonuclease VapC